MNIIDELNTAKKRGLTVMVDNDHISAHDPITGEKVLGAHPFDVLAVLLEAFGLKWENV